MRSFRFVLALPGIAAGLLAVASTAQAVDASDSVYVTSVNDTISEVDWAKKELDAVVVSPGSSFEGLAVTTRNGQPFIVVANQGQGGNIKFCNTSGQCTVIASLPFPSGLTVDPNGNAYVSNQHTSRVDQVWMLRRDMAGCPDSIPDPIDACTNAGFDPQVVDIDDEVRVPSDGSPTTVLADLTYSNGSLYVLAQAPAYLLRYDGDLGDCSGACDPSIVIGTDDFGGRTPTSVAVTSEIYVGTAEGPILRFRLDGMQQLQDFVDVGGRVVRIAVGLLEGSPALVVTTDRKKVLRYAVAGGVGQLPPRIVDGLESPVGVDWGRTTTSSMISGSGAGGTGPATTAFSSLTVGFEDVVVPDFGTVECITFDDPREDSSKASYCPPSPPSAEDMPLGCDLDLDPPGGTADLPAALLARHLPLTIPNYVRGFARKLPDGSFGPKILRLCVASTAAHFEGIVDLHADERTWLGYDPHCDTASDPEPGPPHQTWLRPRFFWGEDEPPSLSEGNIFINATIFCNRDEGNSAKFGSVFLPSVRDTREPDSHQKVSASGACGAEDGIVNCQLFHLKQVLDDNRRCIDNPLRSFAANKVAKAISAFERATSGADYCAAKDRLIELEGAIRCSQASAVCPGTTVAAELRARAAAAIFQLGQPELCGNVTHPLPACP